MARVVGGKRSAEVVQRGPGSPLGASVYDRIRQMLLESELPPGATVTEAELTRLLKVSRTPVREALMRLAGEGFLRSGPGRGYVVVELTAENLADVYAVRIELEGLAVQEAAERCKRVDIARLEDLYDEMTEAKDDEDLRRFADLNNQFHSAVAEISGNAYLKSTLDGIRAIFDVYSSRAATEPGRREETHAEHGALIEALRAHDVARSRALVREHFERSLAIRQAQLARRLEQNAADPS